jgi:hypothetical protein
MLNITLWFTTLRRFHEKREQNAIQAFNSCFHSHLIALANWTQGGFPISFASNSRYPTSSSRHDTRSQVAHGIQQVAHGMTHGYKYLTA